jgi:hypothetical protein
MDAQAVFFHFQFPSGLTNGPNQKFLFAKRNHFWVFRGARLRLYQEYSEAEATMKNPKRVRF